jgi:hypothetical protein
VKFLIKIILVVFLFVQFAPTLVCLVDKDVNCSITLMDEDESSKEEKEFKTEFIFTASKSYFAFNQEVFRETTNNYLIKDYKFYPSLRIIPPKV